MLTFLLLLHWSSLCPSYMASVHLCTNMIHHLPSHGPRIANEVFILFVSPTSIKISSFILISSIQESTNQMRHKLQFDYCSQALNGYMHFYRGQNKSKVSSCPSWLYRNIHYMYVCPSQFHIICIWWWNKGQGLLNGGVGTLPVWPLTGKITGRNNRESIFGFILLSGFSRNRLFWLYSPQWL